MTHDVLVLIDVTTSMVSDEGSGPVWPAVSESLRDLVDHLAPGTNVALVPFDSGPDLQLAYPPADGESLHPGAIDGEFIDELRGHIATLPTDGQGTYIYESVEFALGQLARWRDETPAVTRVQTLVLYTDGKDTGPHAATGVAGLAALMGRATAAGAQLSVVYHDVKSLLSAEDTRLLATAGVQVASPDRRPLVAIDTLVLRLGRLEPGTSVKADVRLTSAFSDAFGRRVGWSLSGPEGVSLSALNSTLSPTMSVELAFGERARPGDGSFRLRLHAVDSDFSITPIDYVTFTFHMATVAVAVATTAPEPVAVAGSMLTHGWRSPVVFAAAFAAVLGVGVALLIGALIRGRRANASHSTFHRLLMRDGVAPTSILDPEARLIALTAEDLEREQAPDEGGLRNGLGSDLDLLRSHIHVSVWKGNLYVRPRDEPLFIGTERVAAEGRALRTGECFRAGRLQVRYDRCVVR
ncbi:MAG: VWA domain-containing protein [Dehalococcoidia bacterium]|nr:MAG: VWA domain-containing protein [Dehalococcoidia bacterium]